MHEYTENHMGAIAANEIMRNIKGGADISAAAAIAIKERTSGITRQILAGRPGTVRHKLVSIIATIIEPIKK